METQTHRPANAALTNILNKEEPPSKSAPPPQLRDSGFYSTAEASSKRPSPPLPR